METRTTAKDEFKGRQGEKEKAKTVVPMPENKPSVKISSYQANFPNWKNGN